MKIAYVAQVHTSSLGVYKKICGQASVWKEQGHKVELFLASQNAPPSQSVFPLWPRFNLCNPRLALLWKLLLFRPEIVYFREEGVSLFLFLLLFFFRSIVFIEINGSTRRESKLTRNNFSQWRSDKLNIFLQPFIIRAVAGIVSVSHELASFEEFSGAKNTIIAPNSIALKQHSVVKKKDSHSPIKIAFLGSADQAWNGTSIIPDLAEALGTGFEFHIIGPTVEQLFSDTSSAMANVLVYGYLTQQDYLPILSYCHIGIGTLALHRKKQEEASPLKVREYIALGLPVILPYKDTAFIDVCPDWVLELPNAPSTFEKSETINLIREFCIKNKDRVVTHAESASYIDSYGLEGAKLEKLAEVIRNQRTKI